MKLFSRICAALYLASLPAMAMAQAQTSYQGTAEEIDLGAYIVGTWATRSADGHQDFVFKSDGTWTGMSVLNNPSSMMTFSGIYEVEKLDPRLHALKMTIILDGSPIDVSDTVIITPDGNMQSVVTGGVFKRKK